MKKIITLTALITIFFSTLQANAQRGNEHGRNGNDRRDYHDNRQANVREERRDNFRGDNRMVDNRGYYQNNNRYLNNAPVRHNYYYYPKANVYYNPSVGNYLYLYNGAWITVNTLPNGVYLDQQYQDVYCNDGENIWSNNYSNLDYYRPAPRQIYIQPARPRVAVGINLGLRF